MSTLNDNHRRRIVSTFVYTDKLLQTVERLATAQLSPFAHEQADLGDAERRLLLALVERARQRMLTALDRLGIPRPRPTSSARWSTDTALQMAEISLSELDGETLRGYGAVSEDDALEVTAVANDLRELVERGRRLLRPKEGERLDARLATIPGTVGEVLREIARITNEHGLVELRALIAAAADRATATSFDVGVFGRVSAGKSSLINALVGDPVLRVGATPVTAVPLRIGRGETRVTVRFNDGRTATLSVNDLPDFASEERNPQNEKDIAEIEVTLPSVEEGLTLLDTPGVGSLSLSGPAQTFAALPRCDLGLVLAAAGTPLGRDELSLVTALRHAGIAVEVLLSKGDLLSEADRNRTVEYLRNELRYADPEGAIPVYAVSAIPAGSVLLASWRERALTPLVAARQDSSARALRKRLEALIAALDSALASQESRATEHALQGQKARVSAESTIDRITAALERAAPQAIDAASHAIVDAWSTDSDPVAAARAALSALPADALAQVRAAADVLAPASNREMDTGAHLPPIFDPPLLDTIPVHASANVLDRMLGRTRARQQIAQLERPLAEAFSRYASRLREWGAVRLSESFADSGAVGEGAPQSLTPEARRLTAMLSEEEQVSTRGRSSSVAGRPERHERVENAK